MGAFVPFVAHAARFVNNSNPQADLFSARAATDEVGIATRPGQTRDTSMPRRSGATSPASAPQTPTDIETPPAATTQPQRGSAMADRMPTIAQFVRSMREAFGDEMIDQAMINSARLKRARESGDEAAISSCLDEIAANGGGLFHATENGHEIGVALTAETDGQIEARRQVLARRRERARPVQTGTRLSGHPDVPSSRSRA